MGRVVSVALGILLGLVTLVAGAQAGSLQVSPIRVELSADHPISAVTVSNTGAAPILVQVTVAGWSQRDGVDQFSDTTAILANPPQFRLAPGAQQIVRYGLLDRGLAAPGELSFRTFLREVPVTAPEPGTTGLRTLLRLSLPVFVAPTAKPDPAFDWSVSGDARAATVRLVNRGNVHVQIGRLSLMAGERSLGGIDAATYVLPGQAAQWSVPVTAAVPPRLTIKAASDLGALQVDVATTR